MLGKISKIYSDFFYFLKNPEQNQIELKLREKWIIIFSILLLDFVVAFITMPILGLLEDLDILKLDYDDFLFDQNILFILLIAGIIVPIIEEIIFRLPLKYSRNYLFRGLDYISNNRSKLIWNKYFKFFFYAFAIVFALIHLSNYNNNSILFFVLAPIIVFSQFFGGLTLGYIRLKLGFIWGVLQHSLFNCFIFAIGFLFFNPEPLAEIKNDDFSLKISQYQIKDKNELRTDIYKTNNSIDSINIINAPIKSVLQMINPKDSVAFGKKGTIDLLFKRKNDSLDSQKIINKKLREHFDFDLINLEK